MLRLILFTILVTLAVPVFTAFNCSKGTIILETGLNNTEKIIVVNRINKYRQMALDGLIPKQPKATSMNMLVYDDGLGENAKAVTEKCTIQNFDRAKDDRFKWVGQTHSMHMSMFPIPSSNWEDVVDGWYEGHWNFITEDNDFIYKGDNYDQRFSYYVQIIWANTKMIGCNSVYFKYPTGYMNKEMWYARLYVCYYGPGGNYVGQAPYPT